MKFLFLLFLIPTFLYSQQKTYIPDDNFEQALIDLGLDEGALDDYVLTASIDTIVELDLHSRKIVNIVGIEDFTALRELDVSNNKLYELNLNNNTNLEILDCGINDIVDLDVSGCLKLKKLDCSSNKCKRLNLNNNTELEILTYYGSDLRDTFDLRKNRKLKEISFGWAFIDELYLAGDSLEYLFAWYSTFKKLDLSKAQNLKHIELLYNTTENINIRNGNNKQIEFLKIAVHDYLSCIQVDNPVWANNNPNWKKDRHIFYSKDCVADENKFVYVPDDNFEKALIDLGYDEGPLDDFVRIENVENIKQLDVFEKGIKSLAGINSFIALEDLNCSRNNIRLLNVTNLVKLRNLDCSVNMILGLNTNIDLSNNTELLYIDCDNNSISNLDLSNCSKLIRLDCDDNLLTELDVSNNPKLDFLSCKMNELTELDVSNNKELREFFCSSNQLDYLDVSNNQFLESFGCQDNLLTQLDVSNCPSLIELYCYDNNIVELDLSENINIEWLACGNNDLSVLNVQNNYNESLKMLDAVNNPDLYCIQVDDTVAVKDYTNWIKDEQAVYSEDCLASVDPESDNLLYIYPNPATDLITIESDIVQKIHIYNMLGELVIKSQTEDSIDVSGLPRGMYFVRIGDVMKKVVLY